MATKIKVTFDLPNANDVIKTAGLGESGTIQTFWTKNIVLPALIKYMPYLTGTFIDQTIANTTSTEIVAVGNQAPMLYDGKVRAGKPKVKTERDINYTKTYNELAGSYWDIRMKQDRGDILTKELQDFINK